MKITSKGQVIGYQKVPDDKGGAKVLPVEGALRYCGYDVRDLVAGLEEERRFGFEETAYLLLTGELPRRNDLKSFTRALAKRRALPRAAWNIITERAEAEDPMGALHTALSAMHLFDPNPNSTDIRDVTRQCVDLIAKFPTIIAYMYQVAQAGRGASLHFIAPDEEMATAPSFLHMLTGKEPDEETALLLDLCLVLHAEHGGGNNSTFTVRTVSSSRANTYMALCSGVASLSGHLHGGANEAVMTMMEEIKQKVKDWSDDEEVAAYVEKILDGKAGDRSGKVFGIGHAVYTLSDPRAIILSEKARGLAEKKDRLDELGLYERVAEQASRLVRKQKKKVVSANVDFYSGFVYDMMGIPQELFTPIFAMSRVVGWSAHRLEEIIQGRLIRPSYISSLKQESLPYTPLVKR